MHPSMAEDIMARTKDPALRAWGVPMTIGILWIIGGALALAASVLTSIVSVLFLGSLLMVVGVLELVSAFRTHRTRSFLVYLLAGLLTIVVGAMFLWRPISGLASLTLVIAAYMFATGLFRGVSAAIERYPMWGWDLFYGIVAVALGAYIAASWPISALWVLGTIVSIEIIVRGIALVGAGAAIRRFRSGEIPTTGSWGSSTRSTRTPESPETRAPAAGEARSFRTTTDRY
jgi:uncharacterized membrane protein HdeD (DUF308 family)